MMKMNKKCQLSITVTLLMTIQVFSQVAEKRDLAKYENGGVHDSGVLMENVNNVQARLREFIWSRWQNRQIGYIGGKFHSKEGDVTIATYYIEQDKNRRWCITVELDRLLVDRKLGGSPRQEVTSYVAYTVECTNRDVSRTRSIPKIISRKDCQLSSSVLRLGNKKGKVLGVL